MQIFFARVVKYDAINYFAAFGGVLKMFPPKNGEQYVFLLKNGLTTCYLRRHISLPTVAKLYQNIS